MLAYIARTFALVLLICAVPRSSRARAEALVTSAGAQLDVSDPRLTRVELAIGVRVSNGLLSSFELLDLDADLEPSAETPAQFVAADGSSYTPSVTVPGPGSVRFAFADKHAAPKPGDYLLRFSYATRALGSAGEPGHWHWSLPRWPNRLANVQIRVLAPKGTRPGISAREQGSDQIDVRELAEGVELSFQRIELPRTQAFVVSFERPAPLASPAIRAPRLAQLPGLPRGLAPWLGLSLGLLWLVKRRLNVHACRAAGLQCQPLLPLWTAGYRGCASLVLCSSAVVLFDALPLLAAISGVLGSLLAIDVARPGLAPDRAGRFRALDQRQLHELRNACASARFSVRDALDATTPTGFASLLAVYALLAGLHAYDSAAVSCSACLVLPVFFTGTRVSRRPSMPGALRELAAQQALLPARLASELAVLEGDARAVAARLRLSHGRVTLDLLVAEQRTLGRSKQTLAWLCEAPRERAAQLAELFPQSAIRHSGEHAHVLARCHDVASEAVELVAALEAQETQPVLARARGAAAASAPPTAAISQLAFLRSSSITASKSLSSRPTTSGCGSKSTNADCSSS
jgi:hypothetical protein